MGEMIKIALVFAFGTVIFVWTHTYIHARQHHSWDAKIVIDTHAEKGCHMLAVGDGDTMTVWHRNCTIGKGIK